MRATVAEAVQAPARQRVLSGIQPSGSLHLGNYLGAIRRWVQYQEQFENFFCIVDLHAITVPQNPTALRENIRQLAALYFAAGIDPQRSTVFVQSHVSAHAELCWVLNCITPMGWLERMTQFKDKAAKEGGNKERISTGLFDYPVLMAADILLYHAHKVPVGEDQKQHVELTRDIAERFNRLYGEVFTVPEPLISEVGARIMGLADPTRKMSKSDNIPGQAIGLLDPPEEMRRAIMRATTDSGRVIAFDPARPGIYNLLTIYQLLSGQEPAAIEARFAGKGYARLKQELADLVIESLRPLQERYRELRADSAGLERTLREGAERARAVAEATLRRVKEVVGLG